MRSSQEKSKHQKSKVKPNSLNTKPNTKTAHEDTKSDPADASPCQFDSGTVLSDLYLKSEPPSEDEDFSVSSDKTWADSGLQLDSGLDSGLGIEPFPSDLDIQSQICDTDTDYCSSGILLEDKSDCDIRVNAYQDQDGDSILHLAVVHGDPHLVFHILSLHPEYLNVTNHLSQTALHLAVLLGNSRLVRRLVVCGAQVSMCDHCGDSPLHLACRLGRLECVQALTVPVIPKEVKEAGIQQASQNLFRLDASLLQQRNYDGLTCVHLAAMRNHKVLEYIVQCGADVNAKEGKSGKTVLHLCAESGQIELVHFLLAVCQAEVNVRTYARYTPLHLLHLQQLYKGKNARTEALIRLLRENGGEPRDFQEDSDYDTSDNEESE